MEEEELKFTKYCFDKRLPRPVNLGITSELRTSIFGPPPKINFKNKQKLKKILEENEKNI